MEVCLIYPYVSIQDHPRSMKTDVCATSSNEGQQSAPAVLQSFAVFHCLYHQKVFPHGYP